jgi:hypothetical protein
MAGGQGTREAGSIRTIRADVYADQILEIADDASRDLSGF